MKFLELKSQQHQRYFTMYQALNTFYILFYLVLMATLAVNSMCCSFYYSDEDV
jgi:hypothetical protein